LAEITKYQPLTSDGYLVPGRNQTERHEAVYRRHSKWVSQWIKGRAKTSYELRRYAGSRLLDIDNLQGKNNVPDRGQQIHDLLQDFSTLIDEMDDNIDEYAKRGQDMRKALPEVIKAESDYETRLRTLQQTVMNDPKAAQEYRAYNFALEDAMESLRGSLEDAQKTLADQIEQFKELEEKQKQEKKKKKY